MVGRRMASLWFGGPAMRAGGPSLCWIQSTGAADDTQETTWHRPQVTVTFYSYMPKIVQINVLKSTSTSLRAASFDYYSSLAHF